MRKSATGHSSELFRDGELCLYPERQARCRDGIEQSSKHHQFPNYPNAAGARRYRSDGKYLDAIGTRQDGVGGQWRDFSERRRGRL